ncbi:MAG: DoxX family protein [Planctomycetota bacterium]|nr:DoxX family protein [Planctomycetota bacterium]MCZ6734920.1 DoxX family protein [Planctomycetota bacterium]
MSASDRARTPRRPSRFGWMWSIFIVRWVLGMIFFMAGWWKCFGISPVQHAEMFFLEQFQETWIPVWWLWGLGVTIPVVELLAGAMVCLGLARRPAYLALGAILVFVTYGHLLIQPLFDTTSHVFPRLTLLVFVMAAPRRYDVLSVDHLIAFLRR